MLPPTFTSFDGTSIRCWAAAPTSVRPAAKILLVHGRGTHSDSLPYRNLREYLTGRGFAAYGFDLRGHGRSGGRRSFVNQWRDFREDLRLFVKAVEVDGASVPLFLLGMSLGGLIAVNYAVYHPEGIQGLIAAAPALDASGVPAWLRKLNVVLSKVFPTLALKPGLDEAWLTRDQQALQEFVRDPLRQEKMTLRLGSETIAAISGTLERLPLLKLPLLVLHGSADAIVPPVAGERLYQLSGSADKEYLVYEGAYHVLFMETNREQVFEDISRWVMKRLGPTCG
ncbi:MAG: hypothetical protein A3H28_00130 [Acidobacteria bacterium RIFCSPLOWO2_02_FULL_61_28]|nr:MAG: hypothetical protein A3H28_00130 [Acidobacteria bacterium RIFCSPLOWO2_02_FULL_61_28]